MPSSTTQEHVYKHSWELVMDAYHRRFPNHPMNPVLLDTEVLENGLVPGTKMYKTVRRMRVNVEAPYYVKKMLGVQYAEFLSITLVNMEERWMRMTTTNETLSGAVTIFETCSYRVHPDNPDWTYFKQTASLMLRSLFGVESIAESLALKSYEKNCGKGRIMDQAFVDELIAEGWSFTGELGEFRNVPELRNSEYTANALNHIAPQYVGDMPSEHEVYDLSVTAGLLSIDDSSALCETFDDEGDDTGSSRGGSRRASIECTGSNKVSPSMAPTTPAHMAA